jgi:hypothetical protein
LVEIKKKEQVHPENYEKFSYDISSNITKTLLEELMSLKTELSYLRFIAAFLFK